MFVIKILSKYHGCYEIHQVYTGYTDSLDISLLGAFPMYHNNDESYPYQYVTMLVLCDFPLIGGNNIEPGFSVWLITLLYCCNFKIMEFRHSFSTVNM